LTFVIVYVMFGVTKPSHGDSIITLLKLKSHFECCGKIIEYLGIQNFIYTICFLYFIFLV